MTIETLTVPDDWTPVDLLLFRRYRRVIPGLAEATFASNPGLAEMGVFPPAGTKVRVTTPTLAQRTGTVTRTAVKLYD